jgi:iron complex outermembrane receptor protein
MRREPFLALSKETNEGEFRVSPQKHFCKALVFGCVSVGAVSAHAQVADAAREPRQAASAQSDVLQEIVVTATRREQALSKVPLSVVAMDQQILDKQGVRSADDLMRLTPSITFGQSSQFYGTGQSNISIRGIQSTSGIPTTGVYIDDTPVQTRTGVSPSLTNAYPQIFDLDRVEVLRGPQGTLFGTGSLGGAVRFITPAPVLGGSKLYARSEMSATENGGMGYEAGVAGGAAIVDDTLGFRASISHRYESGYIDRLDRGTGRVAERDINDARSTVGRVALGWKPAEDVTITPSVLFQQSDIDDSSLVDLGSSDTDRNELRNRLFVLPEPHNDRLWLPALKATVDFDGFTLISNTSFLTRKTTTSSDDISLNLALFANYFDYAPPPGLEAPFAFTHNRTSQKSFTQELRLQSADDGPVNWVTGAFFSRSTTRDQFGGVNTQLLPLINFGLERAGAPPVGSVAEFLGAEPYQGLYVIYQRSRYFDLQKSLFAQVDYEIVPRLKLTAGVRYTDATFELENFVAGPLVASEGLPVTLESDSRPVTPKFGISFQADDDNLFYANAAKGVRGSGVSEAEGVRCIDDGAAIGFDPLTARKVQPDTLWSYEVGSKNSLADGRFAIDAAAYHVDWKNVQSTITLPGCQVHTTMSFGDAVVEGIDLSLSAAPLPGLLLSAAMSYTDARYSTDLRKTDGTIIRRKDEPLDVAPWSMHFSGEYEFVLSQRDLYLRADYTHTTHDDTPLDLDSPLVDPGIPRRPSTSQLDMRAGIHLGDLELSLFVNNVLNAHPWLGLVHSSPADPNLRTTTFRPRTIGLTATFRQ